MSSPEMPAGRLDLPPEIREKLKRLERHGPWEVGLAAVFVAALAGLLLSVLFGRDQFEAHLQVPGPVIFGVLALLALLGWFAQDRSRRARSAEFLAMAEVLHSHACTELAMRDPVSGAYNRVALRELSTSFFKRAARAQKPLTLTIFRLEDFRRLSESFGHAGADLALAEFARILQSATRGSDVVARYEADEFVILMTDTSRLGAEMAILRVRNRLSGAGVRIFEEDVGLSFLAGAAVLQEGMDFASLYREAQVDLLREKSARGGAVKSGGNSH